MFVYKFHCAQELTEGFTDINVLIIPFKKRAAQSVKQKFENLPTS